MKKAAWGVRIAVLILLIWALWGNKAVQITDMPLSFTALPKEFAGFKIAQVSDLHNTEFGKGNEKLLRLLRAAEPDIIAITGDIVDSRRTDTGVALAFLEEALKIAPCYYVTGNHEGRTEQYPDFKKAMKSLGVNVLDNRKLTFERGGAHITLMGINDPNFSDDGITGYKEEVTMARIGKLKGEEDGFTLLLAHRPEVFSAYVQCGVDLVLTGHVHGGQFRVPFLGGLYAPGQGFFPEYDAGFFQEQDTTMVVSRGLGNSVFPLRLNNRPEIVLITLNTQ